ncbi:MAG: anti-sigma F factor [Clostridia bacterium]|nr:anti-sigma F factor [Clostridia bacterium]
MENYMKLSLLAIGENECFARNAVAAFALYLNPTLEELSDVKTAVSEAVTNCIVHAYEKDGQGEIVIECRANETSRELHITITDHGRGIEDVEKAVLPFFTTLEGEERSGMGFTIMQTFMSEFSLKSGRGEGTVVEMCKKIGA